jgi:predicted ATPase
MRQGLATYQATGAKNRIPAYLQVLAEAYGRAERVEKGLSVMAKALAAVHDTRWCEAELYRLYGELLLLLHNRHIFPFHYSSPDDPSFICRWA